MKWFFTLACLAIGFLNGHAQNAVTAAQKFIDALDDKAKAKALYPFDNDERYHFHFYPLENRKGLSLNAMTPRQRTAARRLVNACLSKSGQEKAMAIMQLESVLKSMEGRKPGDHFRDTGNYYFTLFGLPGENTIWGWRLEGHHLSFSFSAAAGKLVSGTPAFMGANPAIVTSGPQAGKQVLKEEADQAFALLHSLSPAQMQNVRIDTTAPNEIITFVNRTALIEHPAGLRYADMTPMQQQQLLQLVGVYVHRFTKLFANAMLKEIQQAGLDELRFAWAGATEPEIGKAHYYRIQGPTIIIEYDNSQNNANHVHSVLRDLKNDFGGDVLMQHYYDAH